MESVENRKNELLNKISEDNKLCYNVYEASCIYFIVNDGKILEISDDASCDVKGSWFPHIVSGLKDDEYEFIKDLMDKYSFDERFFNKAIKSVSWSSDDIDVEEDEIIEYFENEEDEDVCNKLMSIIDEYHKTNLFDSFSYFLDCVRRFELDSDSVYYWWADADDYIDLYENILECGEPAGEYDDYDDEGWVDILENITNYKV